MNGPSFEGALTPGAPHHLLHRLVGQWSGTAKTWFEPGVLADESPVSGAVTSLLDGRFVAHDYSGTLAGAEMLGHAIFGFDADAGEFTMAWVDTCHMGTAMMVSRGAPSPDGQGEAFRVLGHYGDPGGGPDWGWATTLELLSVDHLRIVHDNIPPGVEPYRGVEFDYQRVSSPGA